MRCVCRIVFTRACWTWLHSTWPWRTFSPFKCFVIFFLQKTIDDIYLEFRLFFRSWGICHGATYPAHLILKIMIQDRHYNCTHDADGVTEVKHTEVKQPRIHGKSVANWDLTLVSWTWVWTWTSASEPEPSGHRPSLTHASDMYHASRSYH